MSFYLISEHQEKMIIIPEEAIRIRIISNSNKESDILVKEKLKDKLTKTVNKMLENTKSIDEARAIIKNGMDFLTDFVEKELRIINYDDSFSLNYGLNYFPEKVFKGVQYDEGFYESLVVTLGEGNGNNYWCVLYPPLCNIDSLENDKEYRFYIKELMDRYL